MVPNPAFAALRELLARPPEPLPGEAVLASGLPELDRALAGGFPRGTIATLEGAPSSGTSAVAARLLAQGTREGLGALVQREGHLSAAGLAAAGVALERLAIVRVEEPLGVLRAADILVRSGAFAVVAIPVPPRVRGIGPAAWNRLAGLAQRTGTLLAVSGVDPPQELCAAAALRLGLAIGNVRFRGPSGLFGELAGYDVEAVVRKHRRGVLGGRATLRCEPLESRPLGGMDERPCHLGLGTADRNLRG